MNLKIKSAKAEGFQIAVTNDGQEVGRAYIYLMHNDLHDQPFALMEDIYVDETFIGQGLGSQLVNQVMAIAKEKNCYKLIATSTLSGHDPKLAFRVKN